MDRAAIPTDAALHDLAHAVGAAVREHGAMLATAESCTGGWIAKCCTEVAGSSAWFQGSVVSYANDVKQALLGVPPMILERFGAVSRECALTMVAGALARLGATVAVAVTGIAGPDGGTSDKPVGTVWIAWARRGGDAMAARFHFDGDRDAVRRQAVAAALDGVRKILTA